MTTCFGIGYTGAASVEAKNVFLRFLDAAAEARLREFHRAMNRQGVDHRFDHELDEQVEEAPDTAPAAR